MRRRQAGTTLIELMAVLAFGAVVLGTASDLGWRLLRSWRMTSACVRDLVGVRRALAAVEHDLRGASGLDVLPAGARVHRDAAVVRYELTGGELWREAQGGRRRLARGIAAFDLRPEGDLVQVSLALQPRSEAPSRRDAFVQTRVLMRGRVER